MIISIIGAGASGLMAAATILEKNDQAQVYLLEKNYDIGRKLLLTGGGRCNLTTGLTDIKEILKNYPRGQHFLKYAMYEFLPVKVYEWFENHGVPLKNENQKIYPFSNKAGDVINVFKTIFSQHENLQTICSGEIKTINRDNDKFVIEYNDGQRIITDKLIVGTGGEANTKNNLGYSLAQKLGHSITPLRPSLQAFLLEENWIKDLSGVSFPAVNLKLNINQKVYEKFGPILFTHFGITGPTVFALSSLSAYEEVTADKPAQMHIDFIPDSSYEQLSETLQTEFKASPRKNIGNVLSLFIPKSLVEKLLHQFDINPQKIVSEINKKEINRLIDSLKNLKLTVNGRKEGEEMVTAGGINLTEINPQTMESKLCPNLYFAGEILDIDGFTGGFNLQAAWATGKLAGENAAK